MDANQYLREHQDLVFRITLANFVLELIRKSDDPRRDVALMRYAGQKKELEDKLKALEASPHDVVVGLKPATLSSELP